jgi:predicted Zn-dependent peptidase
LCYAVHTFASGYADTGLFGIYAGTGPKDLPELLRVVAAETEKLLDEATEEEVARARAQIKAGLLMGQESCSTVCAELASQLLYFGRRIPMAETVAKIEAVDAAAVRQVGRRLLAGKPATLVALGPVGRKLPEVGLDRLAA